MSRRILFPVCALLAAFALYWFDEGRSSRGPAPELTADRTPAATEAAGAAARLAGPSAPFASRDAAAVEAASDGPSLTPARSAGDEGNTPLAKWTARGVVLDPEGAPVLGIDVVASRGRTTKLAVARGDGRFEAEVRLDQVAFEAHGDGRRTVFAGTAERQRAELEAVVISARTLRLSGVVRSTTGAELEGARLSVEAPWMGIVGFPRSLERSARITARWKTGPGGRFDLDDVPWIPGVPLSVEADGHRKLSWPLPTSDTLDVALELAPLVSSDEPGPNDGPTLFGTVETAAGRFVGGADVYLSGERTRTNEAGRWELVRPRWPAEDSVLAALHPTEGAGTFPDSAAWQGAGDRIGPLRIELGPNDRTIRGRVVDATGSGLKGWVVQVLDPTSLDPNLIPSATLESRGKSRSGTANTAEDGAFELGGLLERAYDLRAYDPKRFTSIMAEHVPAGTEDLELRLAEGALLESLSVTVRARDGAPVAQAQVSVQFVLERSRTGYTWDTGPSRFTDDDGVALVPRVPRTGVSLIVSGAGIVTQGVEPGAGGFTGEPLVVEVLRRVDVLVDASGASPVPDSLQLLDAEGRPLQIESRTSGGSTSSTSLRLDEGRSPVVSVSEAARTAVLLRDWEELRRFAVDLVPGEVNRVAPPQ